MTHNQDQPPLPDPNQGNQILPIEPLWSYAADPLRPRSREAFDEYAYPNDDEQMFPASNKSGNFGYAPIDFEKYAPLSDHVETILPGDGLDDETSTRGPQMLPEASQKPSKVGHYIGRVLSSFGGLRDRRGAREEIEQANKEIEGRKKGLANASEGYYMGNSGTLDDIDTILHQTASATHTIFNKQGRELVQTAYDMLWQDGPDGIDQVNQLLHSESAELRKDVKIALGPVAAAVAREAMRRNSVKGLQAARRLVEAKLLPPEYATMLAFGEASEAPVYEAWQQAPLQAAPDPLGRMIKQQEGMNDLLRQILDEQRKSSTTPPPTPAPNTSIPAFVQVDDNNSEDPLVIEADVADENDTESEDDEVEDREDADADLRGEEEELHIPTTASERLDSFERMLESHLDDIRRDGRAALSNETYESLVNRGMRILKDEDGGAVRTLLNDRLDEAERMWKQSNTGNSRQTPFSPAANSGKGTPDHVVEANPAAAERIEQFQILVAHAALERAKDREGNFALPTVQDYEAELRTRFPQEDGARISSVAQGLHAKYTVGATQSRSEQ